MASVISSSAAAATHRFKLIFFTPPSAAAACKRAIFAAGAGRLGMGQFRPGDTANPHIGTVGELEEVEEARVETLCVGEETVRKAVAALKE
ncbi:uncharacterized protein PG986_015106 [Apiospora aurea]|uniref:ATP phosphoribosyltransferase n=1 Tax=Apiospora aurea TaxID=335848 RepID=A0ABR1PSM4_9PEZI